MASDLKHYIAYAMERDHYQTETIHDIMADFLQGSTPKWQRKKKVILGFRGFGKTYTAVRRYIEWRILRVPDTQVIVQSSTDRLAGAITQALMETFKYDPLFEGLRPKSGTGTMAFTLECCSPEKGEQVQCAGIKSAMTGSRAHLYIFDDPEPDVQPEALYDRILAAFQEAEFILHPPDQLWDGDVPTPEQTQFVVVGQPHWTGTAYIPRPIDTLTGDQEPHPLNDAIFLRIPALRRVPRGTPDSIDDHPDDLAGDYAEMSNMPSRFPTDSLLRKRNQRIIDPPRWRLQMDIDTTPVEGVGSVIKVSRLPVLHRDPMAGTMRTMIVDPADSEDGCEWGICIAAMYGNMIHILDLMGFRSVIFDDRPGRMPGEEAWETIFEYAEQLSVQSIYIEKNLKHAATAAKRVMRTTKLRASIWEYPVTQNKLLRIVRSLDAPMNGGMVSFEPHILDDGANFRQISELRHMRLPVPNDRLDALAAMITRYIEVPSVTSTTKSARQWRPQPGVDYRPPSFRAVPGKGSPFTKLREQFSTRLP